MKMTVSDRAVTVIADRLDQLNINNVTLGSTLFDLGADSISLIELQIDLEDKFDIYIPNHVDLKGKDTVLDVIALIERYMKNDPEDE
jgi:acyl carrier protein